MPEDKTNGWGEWSKHVLLELERLGKNQDNLSNKLDNMIVQMTESNTEHSMQIEQATAEIKKFRDDMVNCKENCESKVGGAFIEINGCKKDIKDLSNQGSKLQGSSNVWQQIWMYILTAIVIGYFGLGFIKAVVEKSQPNEKAAVSEPAAPSGPYPIHR